MNEIDRRLATLAATQHQVFSRSQAFAAGLSYAAITRRLRTGMFEARGNRALTFAGVALTFGGQLQAGLIDLGPEALVSGRAAAALHGLDGFAREVVELLVPRVQRGRSTSGEVTSSAQITKLDRVIIDGLPCTSGTRTIVQLLGRASEREVGNALDSASRKHLTAPSIVRRRLDELGTQGRTGVALFNRVMECAGVQSWLEREFLALVRALGLPKPALQRTYRRDGVHVARVDFDFAPFDVIVEVGGRKGYLSFDERRRQERRRNELQLLGRTVYFFTTEDVVEDRGYVIATIRDALVATSTRPTACGPSR